MNLQRFLRYSIIAAIAGVGLLHLTNGDVTNPRTASCNELSIPAVGITRCVVDGGQAQIDAGNVVRYTSLSSENVDWLAGHRTSHGATFNALTGIVIGDTFTWEGRTYTVTNADVVNRNNPGYVLGWTTSPEPTVVLQTSKSGLDVYVWRAIATGPAAPVAPPTPDTPPAPETPPAPATPSATNAPPVTAPATTTVASTPTDPPVEAVDPTTTSPASTEVPAASTTTTTVTEAVAADTDRGEDNHSTESVPVPAPPAALDIIRQLAAAGELQPPITLNAAAITPHVQHVMVDVINTAIRN